ncbi:hypothetical protein C8F01DRAFT_1097799 [Mycena amicta]|nr:hypothetical protein C8F01DRAFT_1097799 [Mycena amicta]
MSMQTIPEDIAADIFVHCLPPSIVYDEHLLRHPSDPDARMESVVPNPPDPHTAPLLLLHVCRAWRYLALVTPRLWMELSLPSSELPTSLRDAEVLRTLVAEWFSRAGSRPLAFFASGCPDILLKEVIRLWPNQLQTLHLSCGPRGLSGIPALALDSLPLLETLVLHLRWDWDHGVEGITDTDILLGSPKLRKVFLHIEFPATIRVRLLCPMLATASLLFISGNELLDFITTSPSLVHLECNIGPYLVSVPEELMITCDHLKTLRIRPGSVNTSDLLRRLYLPALEVFELAESVANLDWLDILPGLTHVEFHYIDHIILPFFHRLNRTKNPDFLSQLRSLAIINVFADNGELTVLADSLSSRLTTLVTGSRDGCLESCRVVYPDLRGEDRWVEFSQETFTPELIEMFRALAQTGMEIFLDDGGRD